MNKILAIAFCLALCCGCMTNYYEQFYNDGDRVCFDSLHAVGLDEQISLRMAISEDDVVNTMEEGYLPIGSSSFRSPYNTMVCAVDTAEKHGAQLVLFDIKYKETKDYTSVIFLPSTSVSYTYGTANATAFGPQGPVYASGNYSGTTTTTTLNAVPVQRSVDIYSHNALFFKKIDPRSFYGVVPFIPKRLPTERKDDQVPVTILAVIHGSQAEADGFHKGQRIVAINGKKLTNRRSVAPFAGDIASIKKVEVSK